MRCTLSFDVSCERSKALPFCFGMVMLFFIIFKKENQENPLIMICKNVPQETCGTSFLLTFCQELREAVPR